MNTHIIKLILAIAAVIAFSACINNHKESDKTIIDVQYNNPIKIRLSVDESYPISGVFTQIQSICLDENTENISGVPQSMEVSGDTIYMIDSNTHPGIYAYLHDGSQVFSYCSVGSGPEDLLSPFTLSITDSLLSVFDYPSHNIVFFDKNGRFVKKYQVSWLATGAISDKSGGIWTDYSNQRYETTRLSWKASPDDEETEILSVPEHIKGRTEVGVQDFSRLDDGTINYIPTYEPVVYGLSDGKVRIKYELDFDGLWPDKSTMEKFGGNDWAIKAKSFPIQKIRVVENDRWLIISFNNESQKYIHIFNKTESTGITYKDDQDKYFSPQAISGNRLYIPTKEDTIEVIDLSITE